MTVALRRNRKGSDSDILRYNGVGMSLSSIAEKFDCHPTSVTLRLKGLGVPAADTRRSFMEGVFSSMDASVIEEVADHIMGNDDTQPK